MPNGRSGGFLIQKTDLQQLLKEVPGHANVGLAITGPVDLRSLSPPWSDMDAVQLMSLAAAFPGRKVWVEEQHATEYVLHLDDEVEQPGASDTTKWVVIPPDSPLFGALRRCHLREQRWWAWLRRLLPL